MAVMPVTVGGRSISILWPYGTGDHQELDACLSQVTSNNEEGPRVSNWNDPLTSYTAIGSHNQYVMGVTAFRRAEDHNGVMEKEVC